MSKDKYHLTDSMGRYLAENEHHDHLTAIEWIQVLAEMQQRMLVHGLTELWEGWNEGPDTTELIAAAKDIRDNPGTDAHGTVRFCAIENPKLERLRDALEPFTS